MNSIFIKKFFLVSTPIFLLACSFFFFLNTSFSATSPDAIAIRILPNQEHYSISRWYNEQGFKGSPQSLTVDGYEAIRDGRTVYVNVGNVSNNNLYTNIYLISYNQDSEEGTTDIFGQILSHWKFNTNLTEPGTCNQDNSQCNTDSDCSTGYCSSTKSKVIRDTKRAGDLVEIQINIEDYKNTNNKFPCLSSGSYLPNKTISVWPSWQGTLGQDLKTSSLPVDPINKLGTCQGYDKTTCWDRDAKKFFGFSEGGEFNLPTNSYAYIYQSNTDCSTYNLYAEFESGFTIDFSDSISTGSGTSVGGSTSNQSPVIGGANLPMGWSGKKYEGYITASDPDKDSLTWTLNIPKEDWQNNSLWTNISANFLPSSNNSMKKIYAEKVGREGDYNFSISIDDGKGKANSTISKNYTIKISNDAPTINSVSNKELIIGKDNLNLSIDATDKNENYPLTFSISGLPNGLSGQTADYNTYKISGIAIDTTKDYNTSLIATDYYGKQSLPSQFNIRVKNNPPVISNTSIPEAIACNTYSYQINTSEPDGHQITERQISGLPEGLLADNNGLIGGVPKQTGNHSLTIRARDEYYDKTEPKSSAEATKTLNLSIVDEVFSVSHTSLSGNTIHVYPSTALLPLYYSPVQYSGESSATAQGVVYYSLKNNPSWLTIDENTGDIQGTPTNNSTDPGEYDITVVAINDCGISYEKVIHISVKSNEWCGDKKINSTEKCDDGNAVDNDGCSKNCIIEAGWLCTGEPSVCSRCGDNICSANETATSCSKDCTFSWSTGVFGACSNTCGDGTKTRSVICKNGGGATVSNSLCTATKPATSQSCTDYSGCPADFYGEWYFVNYVFEGWDDCEYGFPFWYTAPMSPCPGCHAYTCKSDEFKTCWDTDWNNEGSGWSLGRQVYCYPP